MFYKLIQSPKIKIDKCTSTYEYIIYSIVKMSTIPTLFIPTLDISNGKAVIIKNGKVDKILGDPLEKAQFLSITKNFQLTDVDRATGTGDNKEIIKAITTLYPCYVGGGIRTYEDAYEMINSNARRVIISTGASELIDKLPKKE